MKGDPAVSIFVGRQVVLGQMLWCRNNPRHIGTPHNEEALSECNFRYLLPSTMRRPPCRVENDLSYFGLPSRMLCTRGCMKETMSMEIDGRLPLLSSTRATNKRRLFKASTVPMSLSPKTLPSTTWEPVNQSVSQSVSQ